MAKREKGYCDGSCVANGMECNTFRSVMSETASLRVFHDGFDWVIAESTQEAAQLAAKQYGSDNPSSDPEKFVALAPETLVGVLCVNGVPDDHGKGIKKTCAEWIAQCGKGVLCSRDF